MISIEDRCVSGKKFKGEKFGQKMGMDWDGNLRGKRSLKASKTFLDRASELW